MPAMLPPGAVPRSPAPAAALFGLAGQPGIPQVGASQAGAGLDLMPGERVLPTRPTSPPGFVPQWPQPEMPQGQQPYQPQPQYQPAPPPGSAAYLPQQTLPPPQPGYQPPPGLPHYQAQQPYAPQATAPQPAWQQYTMSADPQQPALQPYQFNDGMQLGGRASGAQSAGALGVPPAAPAPVAPPATGVAYTPPAQPQVAGQVGTTLRDALAATGNAWAASYASDQMLLDDMGQMGTNLSQLRQMARLGWEAQQQTAQPQTQSQPAPAPQLPAQPTPAKPQRSPRPEWKPEWDGLVRRDPQSGRFVPSDAMVNPLVAERANELQAWERQRASELVNSGLTREDLEAVLVERETQIAANIRQQLEQDQQVQQANQLKEKFLADNRQAFYAHDQAGQPVVNPITREPVLSPIGQVAFAAGNQFTQQFEQLTGQPPHPQMVIDHVRLTLQAQYGQQPPQPQPMQPMGAAPPTAQQLKDQVIQGAVARQQALLAAQHVPNQGGTIAAAAQQATQQQNPRQSFGQMLLEAAVAKGQVPQGYVPQFR